MRKIEYLPYNINFTQQAFQRKLPEQPQVCLRFDSQLYRVHTTRAQESIQMTTCACWKNQHTQLEHRQAQPSRGKSQCQVRVCGEFQIMQQWVCEKDRYIVIAKNSYRVLRIKV